MRSYRHHNHPHRWRRLLWWLVWLPLCAQAVPAVTTGADFRWLDLAQHVDVLQDPGGRFDAAAVAQAPLAEEFVPARTDTIHRGDRGSTYWLRFAITNTAHLDRSLLLTFRLPRDDDIAAYAVGNGIRELPKTIPSGFQLHVPADAKRLFLVRIAGNEPGQLELHSIAHYLRAHRDHTWLDGAGQGGLSILALGALLLLWSYREPVYGWLAAHTVVLQGFLLSLDASSSLLPMPWITGSPLQPMSAILLLLLSITSLRLARRLPITGDELPWAQRALRLALIVSSAALPLMLLVPTATIAVAIVCVVEFNVLLGIAIALLNFLAAHHRHLLVYALIRTLTVILMLGGVLAWNAGSASKPLLLNLLPFAMLFEGLALLALLLWRSHAGERVRARNDRQIAILEAESRSRTEVTAEIGHRMRTPISGVLGMLDMLQDTPLSAVQLDYLNTIRRAGNELLNVVDELSDLGRTSHHSTSLQLSTFDPQALVAECVDGLRSLAAAQHLELINDPSPTLPAYVSGDPTRVRQLVLQLLHSAAAQREAGEIVVSIEPLPAPGWLRFRFATLAEAQHAPATTIGSRPQTSAATGVRMAIARQLLDQLGGRFGQRALDGAHTELWFDLPLPTAQRSAVAPEAYSVLRNRSLLVVDDSPTFCEVLRRQAGHWNMVVHTATSTSEGLARLRNQIALDQPIDALLVDADMPELQGGDWLLRLREIQPQPIVLLLSSLADTPAAHDGVDVRRVLLKPVNHNTLKITLIEELKRRDMPVATAAAADGSPIRCLYAEDNAINAKVLAGMLAKLGVDATGVDNGQEAVEAMQREAFDIVLMDCDMPVMDGWEASKRIREICRTRGRPETPIIALTANTVEELGERARQPIMDAHLVKPMRLEALRELLEHWTGKRTAGASTLVEPGRSA